MNMIALARNPATSKMTIREMAILTVVYGDQAPDNLGLRELAEQLPEVAKPILSRMVSGLVDRNLLVVKPRADDKRLITIRRTAQGMKFVKQFKQFTG